jgi:hypothetical protein
MGLCANPVLLFLLVLFLCLLALLNDLLLEFARHFLVVAEFLSMDAAPAG